MAPYAEDPSPGMQLFFGGLLDKIGQSMRETPEVARVRAALARCP